MSESIRADGADINGSYTNGIIRLAIRNRKPEDVIRTLRHEGIHALRGLNAIKESEWAVLSKRADQEWINKYLDRVKANKEGDSLRKVYEDMYRSQGLNDQQIKERIQEEAVAEAFADYTPKTPESRPDTPPPSGFIKEFYLDLKSFLKLYKNLLERLELKKKRIYLHNQIRSLIKLNLVNTIRTIHLKQRKKIFDRQIDFIKTMEYTLIYQKAQ